MDADLDQRQTNHSHDQAGHQRRQCKSQPTDEKPQKGVEQTARDDPTHQDRDRVDAFARDERDHNRYESKGCPLHDGQARANRAKPNRLEKRRNPCKEHRHLNHVDHLREVRAVRAKAEACSAANDDRRCDVRYEHRQHVLNSEWHRFC